MGSSREMPEPTVSTGRPDALRRSTIAVNGRLMVVLGGVLMPLALYAGVHGQVVAIVMAVLTVSTGLLSLAMQRRGAHRGAAAAQTYGIFAAGAVLAMAEPAVADFGLAVALLGPIHAALLTGTRNRAWLLLAGVICLELVAASGVIARPMMEDPTLHLTGGLTFAVMALVVAHTANRLNRAFEVYDRAQVNAYRHLLEHVQDAVIRFSTEGDLLFASRSSERLFGCKRFELLGGGLLERIHVLDRPTFLTAFADANQGALARTVEIRMRQDSDTASAAPRFMWTEVALSPVRDADSVDAGRHEVVALFRDVTDRRDQENAMRAARKAAEEASEAKSRFLATIGHELRTPLNAIIGFSEMMTGSIGGQLSPAHREYAELIRKSGNHLISVVGMLLDMSRIEAGKFELNTETLALESLVEPCLNMVEPLARERSIALVRQVSSHLPPIVADERACRQILINLLSNAVKFSPDKGVVTVTIRRQGTHVALTVADNGIGMSPDAVARVGEPFFQAQDGLSRRYEGTGLGLSIVKGLVELHQGVLRVTSSPGQGTSVTVLLPINGPETKMAETAAVTPIRREAVSQPEAQWPEQKRSAK